MESQILNIRNMSCAACAQRIEQAVLKLPGVRTASVNLASEQLFVEYSNSLPLSTIKETVAQMGYPAVEKTLEVSLTNSANQDRARKHKETQVLRTKLIVAVLFTLPLLYIAMAPMVTFIELPFPRGLDPMHHPLAYALVELLLVTPVVFVGYNFYTAGFKALVRRNPTMDSLIAAGTSAALLYSLYNTWQIANGSVGAVESLYYETAGVILSFILLGKTLEAVSKSRTGESIKRLAELVPKTALVLLDGLEKEISVGDVEVGDIIVIKPGAKIPVDGTVVAGYTAIDESMLTGESLPVDKKAGDRVYAASLNTNGTIRFRADKVGSATALARIIKLVEDAQGSKAPIARMADVVSGYFVPMVCVIAVMAGIAWYMGTRDLEFALTIFISVLVIACPCALGLATPTAILVGTGKGAENGILIKNGEALERAHKITAIVLDKTGTITEGKPAVTDVLPTEGTPPETLLRIAASAEQGSEHPLGRAVVRIAREKGLELWNADSFEALTGRGIEASVNGKKVLVGSRKLMDERAVSLAGLESTSDRLAEEGKTPMYVAIDGKPAGIVAVADVVKPSGRAAIETLRKIGLDVVILTGDNKKTAAAIARQVGVDRVLAEVLPQDKSNEIKRLQSDGHIVAMVGDGINDAPALAQADVGVAIGSGTDVAMESANIVLMRSDLMDVPAALKLSQQTVRIIKQNLFWAFGYNILGIPIAAGVLYLFGGPLLNPMFAAAAMSLSSVSVLANALRLRSLRLR